MLEMIKSKKNIIIAITMLFVFVSLSGTTYSLFLKADNTATFDYNTGILDLKLVEDAKIVIENALPVIDSEGLNSDIYTLTIKNVGTLPYLFDLKMLSTTDEFVIDSKYIKVKVNNNKPHTLSSTNNVISSNIIIYPNEELNYSIQIWLDSNTPNDELGKTFEAKLMTSGNAIYKTLDVSGANHPKIIENMISVYYDNALNKWKKADNSNTNPNYEWYNYDNKKWANTVMVTKSDKKIYDITSNHNLNISTSKHNNGNLIIDNTYFDLGQQEYNLNTISNIIRVKFSDITEDKNYIISNGKIGYYYDGKMDRFVFKVDDNVVNSSTYTLENNKWYNIGYTYDGHQVNYYIDGIKLSTSNIEGTIASGKSFKLGTNNTFEKVSNITVADFYMYRDILSETEINTNYKETINVITDNLECGYNYFYPMTLSEYYNSASLGTVIDINNIASFYVWIPRYKYKLWNATGEQKIDTYDAYNKGIDIVFEKEKSSSGVIYCQDNECYSDSNFVNKLTKNDNGKYYTHPAFTNLENSLTGFWVGKYEISTNDSKCNDENITNCLTNLSNVIIKPGISSWRNNTLSNYYQAIKKLGNNYNMIKNSEWGAISYLTNSKYGLCENNQCHEIENNKTYISGNNLKDTTTNNIYGIFDMAGGASEFVMANYADELGEVSLNDSHFNGLPISNNDYNLYKKESFILGDAMKEISLDNSIWYNNSNSYFNASNNWLTRGGNTEHAGLFSYIAKDDMNNQSITTRIIIK